MYSLCDQELIDCFGGERICLNSALLCWLFLGLPLGTLVFSAHVNLLLHRAAIAEASTDQFKYRKHLTSFAELSSGVTEYELASLALMVCGALTCLPRCSSKRVKSGFTKFEETLCLEICNSSTSTLAT